MRTTDRVPGPSRWLCPQCAFDLYPRMSDLDVAGHAVHHRRAHHIAARLRNVPITRSEVEEYVRELDRYVHELELQASTYRGVIADLTDMVEELQAPDLVDLAEEDADDELDLVEMTPMEET